MIKNSLLNNTAKRGHIKRRLKTYFLVIFQILLIANPVIPVNPVGPPYQAPPVGWIIKDDIDFYGTGWDNSSGQSYIDPYHSGYKLTVSPSEITFKTFTDVTWDGYSSLNFSIGAISSTFFSIYVNEELLLTQSIGSGNFTFDVQHKAKLLQLHKYEEVSIRLGSNSAIDYLGFESDRPRYFGVYNTQNYELTFSGL
ncbi:MAG: hypothetical protein HeimC2_13770 [Candidatus Heimdallarchaeota archaeon LC_2]|nr:MAG: hypothetical protein HeimC2_13770 [Candidatus Heimdallarchaeota archaeon LC_2]